MHHQIRTKHLNGFYDWDLKMGLLFAVLCLLISVCAARLPLLKYSRQNAYRPVLLLHGLILYNSTLSNLQPHLMILSSINITHVPHP
jgi:hypothetical protein